MFLCMAVAAALPRAGVPSEHVMASGMLTLLAFIVYAMLCPTCGRKARASSSPVDDITPVAVFIVTGCIGVMLGGMIGGALVHVKLADFFAPTRFV